MLSDVSREQVQANCRDTEEGDLVEPAYVELLRELTETHRRACLPSGLRAALGLWPWLVPCI